MKWCAALLPLTAALILAGSGCAKKSGLQAQTAQLEKAFPGLAAAVAAQGQATELPNTNDPNACVVAAVCAVRRNDVATGVILLRKSARLVGLSAEQLMAVDEARRVWMKNLTQRAARGDESAKAALAAISSAR